MKRILLSAAALAMAIGANAQNDGALVSPNEYSYSFGGTTAGYAGIGWVPGCDGDNATKAITADGSVAGELSLSVDGEQQGWEHVEMDFVDATGLSAVSIDLSAEEHQNISVTFSGTADGQVLFLLGDGTTLHPDPAKGWELSADNVPAIQHDYLAVDGEVTITNDDDTFTGNNSDAGGFGWGVFQSDAFLQGIDMVNIDSSAINQIWVYYRTSDSQAPNCDGATGQVVGTLTLKSLTIGGIVGLNEQVTEASFDAYPNPAENVVNFSQSLESVEVYNVNGNLVESFENVDAIDVSSYEAGLYVIQTTEGYKRISVK